ncbi:MAG: hypothetical protein JWN38_38 [Candidatus Saccharibacteria bacterium]|nr:hypothetical protein [Candidatus Saccharibacteria bacterium]
MRILISHVYSADNKGDAALLGVLIEEIECQWPGAEISILTMDTVKPGETFDGVEVQHSFMHYVNRWRRVKLEWMLYGTFMMGYTLLWARLVRSLKLRLPLPKNWRQLAQSYQDADLVMGVGGGYLRTRPPIGTMYDFLLLLHPIVFSHILGKQTIMYTQSVGPLHRSIERWMLSHVLRKDVALTIIREDKSMALMQQLGVTNAARSVDAGFLLTTDKKAPKGKFFDAPKGKLVIGVTAREWLDANGQHVYEKAMAEALDYLIAEQNAFVVFIPQVTSEFHGDDDRLTSQAIYELMDNKQGVDVLTKNYSYREIKAIYDQLDFLLGTRFHSVIFSLTSYVPALAIEYEHKTSGIMHDLGLDNWVIKMEEVSAENLIDGMNALLAGRAAYIGLLKKILPSYIGKAHSAIVAADQHREA